MVKLSAEQLAYMKRHRMVVRIRGKAAEYYCIDCDGDAQEWSQIQGTDGESADDYEPRCCSCHQKYDDHWNGKARKKTGLASSKRWRDPEYKKKVGQKISAAKQGFRHSEETKKKISATKTGKKNVGKAALGSKRTPEQCERIRMGRWGR